MAIGARANSAISLRRPNNWLSVTNTITGSIRRCRIDPRHARANFRFFSHRSGAGADVTTRDQRVAEFRNGKSYP